jgi:hypothetical protein
MPEIRVEDSGRGPANVDGSLSPAQPLERVASMSIARNNAFLAEPDAILALNGRDVSAAPEMPDGLHVRGGATHDLRYLVDGIPVLNPFHAGGTLGAFNPDAVSDVRLGSSGASSMLQDGLSGSMSVSTRDVPDRMRLAGGLSATQARVMLESPLGSAGPGDRGLLLSGRAIFPGLLGQKREPSQIDGDAVDGLARLTLPLGAGQLSLIGVGVATDMSVAARVPDDEAPGTTLPSRHDFAWSSNSVGLTWESSREAPVLRLAAWRARGGAAVAWHDSVPLLVETRASESGAMVQRVARDAHGAWTSGARVERLVSGYDARFAESGTSFLEDGHRTIFAGMLSRRQRLGRGTELTVGVVTSVYDGRVRAAPAVEWDWGPSDGVTIAVAASRRYQFTQDLRNTESVIGNIFPASLIVGAGGNIPVARGDEVRVGADWRPAAGWSLSATAWARRTSGVSLPPIGRDEVFVTSSVAEGTGRATGAAIEASRTTARFALTVSSLLQRVRLHGLDTTWTPAHGTAAIAALGAIYFPQPSASVRLSVEMASGRRATAFAGPFEWETCNLRDRGCEFAGGPLRRTGALGGLALPAYLRIDVGARKHWHVVVNQRDVLLGVFATWSNVLDRTNVLGFGTEPVTGLRQAIGMRPGSPLVIGLDWSF